MNTHAILSTEQAHLPLVPKIPSAKSKRTVALSSLRPGDWLEGFCTQYVVLQNSAVLQRIEVRYLDGGSAVFKYDGFTRYDRFLGHGQPRVWWQFLPKWLQKRVCPYGGPL